jgi:hypothetical protein
MDKIRTEIVLSTKSSILSYFIVHVRTHTSPGTIVSASATTTAIDMRRQKLSRDDQRSGARPGVLGSSSHPVLTQGGQLSSPRAVPVGNATNEQLSSPGAISVEGKETNIESYLRKFDGDERPSADAMVAESESASAST